MVGASGVIAPAESAGLTVTVTVFDVTEADELSPTSTSNDQVPVADNVPVDVNGREEVVQPVVKEGPKLLYEVAPGASSSH
jgi:predicted metalloprotease with PDZ domain